MKNIKWFDNRIEVEPIKKNKKITGTHFPTILGVNPFATDFEVWCRCTRTFEIPFTGNQYTAAGTTIEPKVFDFLRKSMGFGKRVVTPTDIYGENHFQKTWGDFFPNQEIFGGSWDALIMGDDGKPECVVEIKTVKCDGRSGGLEERWKDGEAPHYQALQASLYAHLLGIDKVLMVAVTLYENKGDYLHPEQVIPSYANENVHTDEFRVSERYPNFDLYIAQATEWWNNHVLSGISPTYDEKKDAEILKALRTNSLTPDADIVKIIAEAEELIGEINEANEAIKDKEKRLKKLNEFIKEHASTQFRDGDKTVEIKGINYNWLLTRTEKEVTTYDEEALKADGVYDKYTNTSLNTTYRMTVSNKN